MTRLRSLLLALAVPLALAGCSGGPTSAPPKGEGDYDVKGKVIALAPAKPALTLDHEDIPGLMKKMTMEFRVEDAKLLEGLQVGDQVQGRLKKTDSGLVITKLEKH
jgi:Cu/Ag efflux protein CusF